MTYGATLKEGRVFCQLLQQEKHIQKTYMVCSNRVHLLDLVRERRSFVDEQLYEIMRGGFSSEQLELFIDRPAPCNNNTCSNLPQGQHAVRLYA